MRSYSCTARCREKKINLGETTVTSVGYARGEKDHGGVTPAEVGQPGALIEAHPARYLEADHDRDDRPVHMKLMHRYLIRFRAQAASSRKAVEAGQEAGAASPLGGVEASQSLQRPDRSLAPVNTVGGALGCHTRSGLAEIAAEI